LKIYILVIAQLKVVLDCIFYIILPQSKILWLTVTN